MNTVGEADERPVVSGWVIAVHAPSGVPDEVPRLDDFPVLEVPIRDLIVTGSPRLAGADPEHIRTLADVVDTLPPITVHRATLQVIDGVHRVAAARLTGRETISARVVDCDLRAAFVLAVQANIAHGLPLSLEDRKAAAVNIVQEYPQWSDRAVAEVTGLSDKTVSSLREGTTPDLPQLHVRLGRDGRFRPLNSAERRQQAAALIRERPDAGLREIARATGLSPATVRDVRRRTESGLDPVPDRYRAPEDRQEAVIRPIRRPAPPGCLNLPADREMMLAKLMNDPTVRFSQGGKYTMRWLYHYTVDSESCRNLGSAVPAHWAQTVATLARGCAMAWTALADQLEDALADQLENKVRDGEAAG